MGSVINPARGVGMLLGALTVAVFAASVVDTAPTAGQPVARTAPASPVRAGTVQILRLPSYDAAGGAREVWVYRPGVPDSATLPVLYFLHGLPGSATDLAGTGLEANLDAAFVSGRLAPFVVVSPDGNSIGASDPEWADSVDGTVGLESFVTGELISAVEGSNRRSRANRAIAGFSMGGFGAMNLALRHPDLYGQLVSIAGYFHLDDPSHVFGSDPANLVANTPDQHVSAAARLRVMLTDGSDDTEPVVAGETQRFGALLRRAGQHPTVLITPGTHNWTYVTSVLPAVESFLEAGWQPSPIPTGG
jgi:S-formylglutathione hydrolase FrmB